MHIITELFSIEQCQQVIKEDFQTNKRKWEIVNISSEKSEIKDGFYWMENKTSDRWNYYKIKTNIQKQNDFLIDSTFELLSKDEYGHFGIVWGFDKELSYLNKFTISADGDRILVMSFEKDYRRTLHRFQNRTQNKIDFKKPVRLTIIKLGNYFHFLLNGKTVYLAHASQFVNSGNYIGYYIEPGLSIKSSSFELKKIKSRQLPTVTGVNQLL
jgi:hypothetical protein